MGRNRFYRFWFHNKDDKGRPLDERLLKAAEEIAPALTRYREEELDCESTANELLQAAIEAGSKAKRTRPIENPIAYITSVYHRFVDNRLDRLNKVVLVDDEILEELGNSGRVESFEQQAHNRLVLEKVMDLMDPKTRQISIWILEGYTQKEIAKDLGMSPNSLTVEFNRGLSKTAKRIRQRFRRPNKQ